MVAPWRLASTASERLPALLTEIPSWRSSSASAMVPQSLGLSMASGVVEVMVRVHTVTRTGMSMRATAMTPGRHRRQRRDHCGPVTWVWEASTGEAGGAEGCDVVVEVLMPASPGPGSRR